MTEKPSDAQTLDYLATLEERMFARKRQSFVQGAACLAILGGLTFWEYQSLTLALLIGCSTAFLALQAGRVIHANLMLEYDRIVFSFQGDFERLRNGLQSRRSPDAMFARQKYYFG
jgi:hypothetical protein